MVISKTNLTICICYVSCLCLIILSDKLTAFKANTLNQPASRQADRSVGRSIHPYIHPSNQSTCQSVGRSSNQSNNRLTKQQINQPINQTFINSKSLNAANCNKWQNHKIIWHKHKEHMALYIPKKIERVASVVYRIFGLWLHLSLATDSLQLYLDRKYFVSISDLYTIKI